MSEIELTSEQQEKLREMCNVAIEIFNNLRDALIEVVENFMQRVREIATMFGRMFLKMQLLEWKIPYPIADFVSEKVYWYWAVRLGFAWFQRKLLLI